MNLSQRIGNRIKQSRKKAGLTQIALAKLLSVSDKSVSLYEQGETLPSMNTAILMAKALNVSLDWLFMEVTNMDSNGTQEFTEDEIELIAAYRKTPKNYRHVILNLVKSLPQPSDRKRHAGDGKNE